MLMSEPEYLPSAYQPQKADYFVFTVNGELSKYIKVYFKSCLLCSRLCERELFCLLRRQFLSYIFIKSETTNFQLNI